MAANYQNSSPSTGIQQKMAPPVPLQPAIGPAGLLNNFLMLQIHLDRTNYPYWQVLVLPAARAYNLDGYILGTIPPPPPLLANNEVNPECLHWIRFDQFILHWLLNSVTSSMLGHILRCRSSTEIWSTLANFFTTKSKARILQITGVLQSTKKGSTTVDDYILKMREYADALAAAGDPITDERLCIYILGGLGPEYEATVINLTNRGDNLTLQDLHFSLNTQ